MAEFPEYNQEWEEGFNCAQDLKRDIRASDARIAAEEGVMAISRIDRHPTYICNDCVDELPCALCAEGQDPADHHPLYVHHDIPHTEEP